MTFQRNVGVGIGFGVQPAAEMRVTLKNRLGLTVVAGRVVAIDLGLSQESDNFRPGDPLSAYGNATFPLTRLHLTSGNAVLALALADVADEADGEFLVMGKVPFDVTLIDSAGDTICQVGDKLFVKNGATTIDCNQAATGRCVGYAIPLADVANVGTTDVPIEFDGMNYLGHQ